MLNFKTKWKIAYDSLEALNQKFVGFNHFVDRSPFGEVLWVKDESGLHAFKNKCPHQNKPLNNCKISEGHVVCPFHQYHFSIETGRGHGDSLYKFEVKIEDEKVWIGKEIFSLF